MPHGVRFLLYLNPIRPNDELPQCRFLADAVETDIVRHISCDVIAEIAVPPFGVIVLGQNGQRLPPILQPHMDISHFGDYALNEQATIELDLPVRTIFGPCPLRYWQDAKEEESFPLAG